MKSVVRCLRPILHIRDWAFAILLFGLAFDRALPEIRAFAQSDDATSRAVPIDASFTYQGRIEADGVPADGAVLMEFKLWDAASGGAAVATVPSSAVAVANGLFAVQLTFGSAHFTGDKRWIETIANGISLGRVELTATPYAAFAQKTGPHSHFGDQWTDSSSLAGIRVTMRVSVQRFSGTTRAVALASTANRWAASASSERLRRGLQASTLRLRRPKGRHSSRAPSVRPA